jgi:hypothetical protein
VDVNPYNKLIKNAQFAEFIKNNSVSG